MMIPAGAAGPGVSVNQSQRPKFVAVSTLEDVQVIIINICTVIVLALQSCSEGGCSSLLSLKPSNSRRCDAPSSTQAADSGRWGATVKHWGFVSILRWRIWGGYLLPFLVIITVSWPSEQLNMHLNHVFFSGRATQRTSRQWCSSEPNTTRAQSIALPGVQGDDNYFDDRMMIVLIYCLKDDGWW